MISFHDSKDQYKKKTYIMTKEGKEIVNQLASSLERERLGHIVIIS